jgi:hypothetical protein
MLYVFRSVGKKVDIFCPRPKEEKQKLYKISIDTLWKNIKKRILFYIVREENIWPQVLGDRIYPPFFQHYEKHIAYRIHKLLFTA